MTIDEIDDGLEYAAMSLAMIGDPYKTHKPVEAIKAAQKIIDNERPHEMLTISGSTRLHCICGQLICDNRDAADLASEGYRYCPACGRRIDWGDYVADN